MKPKQFHTKSRILGRHRNHFRQNKMKAGNKKNAKSYTYSTISRHECVSMSARYKWGLIFIAQAPCMICPSRNRLLFSLCFGQNERDKTTFQTNPDRSSIRLTTTLAYSLVHRGEHEKGVEGSESTWQEWERQALLGLGTKSRYSREALTHYANGYTLFFVVPNVVNGYLTLDNFSADS